MATNMVSRPTVKRHVDGPLEDELLESEGQYTMTPPSADAANKMKLPRTDKGHEDFSSVVKNRLQTYTRTGQACDRCKVSAF